MTKELYRKKPIIIQAQQMEEEFFVSTLEGLMRGGPGDYCITGVEGEQYPCNKRIFEKTYDMVDKCTDEELEDLPEWMVHMHKQSMKRGFAQMAFDKICHDIGIDPIEN